jgi:hypothetical protein
VPHYLGLGANSLIGLGAVLFIRLMPRPLFESSLGAVVIDSAWVPFLFKVGKLAILSKSASSPICNLSGWFAESLFAAVS